MGKSKKEKGKGKTAYAKSYDRRAEYHDDKNLAAYSSRKVVDPRLIKGRREEARKFLEHDVMGNMYVFLSQVTSGDLQKAIKERWPAEENYKNYLYDRGFNRGHFLEFAMKLGLGFFDKSDAYGDLSDLKNFHEIFKDQVPGAKAPDIRMGDKTQNFQVKGPQASLGVYKPATTVVFKGQTATVDKTETLKRAKTAYFETLSSHTQRFLVGWGDIFAAMDLSAKDFRKLVDQYNLLALSFSGKGTEKFQEKYDTGDIPKDSKIESAFKGKMEEKSFLALKNLNEIRKLLKQEDGKNLEDLFPKGYDLKKAQKKIDEVELRFVRAIIIGSMKMKLANDNVLYSVAKQEVGGGIGAIIRTVHQKAKKRAPIQTNYPVFAKYLTEFFLNQQPSSPYSQYLAIGARGPKTPTHYWNQNYNA